MMKKILMVLFAVVFTATGAAWADDACASCSPVMVYGYTAPNLRMIDKGDDYMSNLGFGMAFNRIGAKGKVECGEIAKWVAWKFEFDASHASTMWPTWAFVQPYFTKNFSLRLGHIKRQYSREYLHPTMHLLTVDRHINIAYTNKLGYSGFDYGLEAIFTHEQFMATVGSYAGGAAPKGVAGQDPAIDFAARVLFQPMEDLEVGANVSMISLPIGGTNQGTYADMEGNEYESNSGMAFGFDVDYQREFNDKMGLWAQAELGMGDNWNSAMGGGADGPDAEDTWEDYSWYQFMYYYVKALFMVSPEFGIHLGYSMWDPNTDGDYESDTTTMITPGVVYKWCKQTRTQVEVQLVTEEFYNSVTMEEDDATYTNFVIQQVINWP